jgi:hypothetical protein
MCSETLIQKSPDKNICQIQVTCKQWDKENKIKLSSMHKQMNLI